MFLELGIRRDSFFIRCLERRTPSTAQHRPPRAALADVASSRFFAIFRRRPDALCRNGSGEPGASGHVTVPLLNLAHDRCSTGVEGVMRCYVGCDF